MSQVSNHRQTVSIIVCCTYDSSSKSWPSSWSGIEGVAISKTGVGCPHNLLQFQELGEESGSSVVHFFSIRWDYVKMLISMKPAHML